MIARVIGMGRPPKDPADKQRNLMRIPLTDAEKAAIWDHAESVGQPPTTWAREVLLKATRKRAASGKRGS